MYSAPRTVLTICGGNFLSTGHHNNRGTGYVLRFCDAVNNALLAHTCDMAAGIRIGYISMFITDVNITCTCAKAGCAFTSSMHYALRNRRLFIGHDQLY